MRAPISLLMVISFALFIGTISHASDQQTPQPQVAPTFLGQMGDWAYSQIRSKRAIVESHIRAKTFHTAYPIATQKSDAINTAIRERVQVRLMGMR